MRPGSSTPPSPSTISAPPEAEGAGPMRPPSIITVPGSISRRPSNTRTFVTAVLATGSVLAMSVVSSVRFLYMLTGTAR